MLLAQLIQQHLGIYALDSVCNAIVLNKILYALPVYFGYLTEGHKDMLRRVLKKANRMGFTFHGCDLGQLNKTSQDILFRHCWPEQHCLHHLFTVKSRPPGACFLGNLGTIFSYQTSNMISINATLLLVHFLLCLNCVVFVLCLRVLSTVFFIDNVARAAFLCKHVRLSRVFYNKLTYLLSRYCTRKQGCLGLRSGPMLSSGESF